MFRLEELFLNPVQKRNCWPLHLPPPTTTCFKWRTLMPLKKSETVCRRKSSLSKVQMKCSHILLFKHQRFTISSNPKCFKPGDFCRFSNKWTITRNGNVASGVQRCIWLWGAEVQHVSCTEYLRLKCILYIVCLTLRDFWWALLVPTSGREDSWSIGPHPSRWNQSFL